jgi:hypothetical protein
LAEFLAAPAYQPLIGLSPSGRPGNIVDDIACAK